MRLKLIFSRGQSRDLYFGTFLPFITKQALFSNKDTLPPKATTTARLHNCSRFVQLFRIKLQIIALGFGDP